jgi:NADH-quinone oxidoreductase subunit G
VKTVTIEINGLPLQVEEGTTILNAAKEQNVKIPALCYHPDLTAWAACGICVVKLEGSGKMVRACATPAADGMKILTHDPEIVSVRRTVLELILSTHPNDCLQCSRNNNCELQTLASEFGIREVEFEKRLRDLPVDDSTPAIVLNPEKCINCGRCANVCQQLQNVWALEFLGRGDETRIAPAGDVKLNDSPCIKCGQCSAHCPVGAIYEKDDTGRVWDAILDPEKVCVAQIAPAVRVALGEAFGMEPGTLVTGKAYAALHRLGFDAVFDTNFSADLTIMEEGSEFVQRFVHKKGELPLITSCCPAWVDFMEKYHEDMIPHFSTAKSPQEMMGVMAKTYYAEKIGKKPSEICMVSVMPCTAKKYELSRSDEMFASGAQDIDVSITTRELSRMIKQAGIDFETLPDDEADSPLGMYTGAGTIFGATGGVMEAALRSAYYLITGSDLEEVELSPVRGLEGVKEAAIDVQGTEVRVAIAHGMVNINTVLERVRQAKERGEETPYHFIEVMACRGGCVAGGGQPRATTDEVREQRIKGLYADDTKSAFRCSHHNPAIKKLYEDYLEAPLSKKAHELLHASYTPRPIYQK